MSSTITQLFQAFNSDASRHINISAGISGIICLIANSEIFTGVGIAYSAGLQESLTISSWKILDCVGFPTQNVFHHSCIHNSGYPGRDYTFRQKNELVMWTVPLQATEGGKNQILNALLYQKKKIPCKLKPAQQAKKWDRLCLPVMLAFCLQVVFWKGEHLIILTWYSPFHNSFCCMR